MSDGALPVADRPPAAPPDAPPATNRHGGRTSSLLAAAGLLAALAFAAVLGSQPLSHDDLFWHLRAGRLMVEQGQVLHTDPLSFTRAGAEWVTHEWGFSLLVWAVERVAGLDGLVILRALLVVAFFALVGLTALRFEDDLRAPGEARAPDLSSLALWTAVAAWAGSRQLILRAALPGAVALAAVVLLLHRFRRRPSAARGLVIVAVILVWANLHSGVVFGLALVALTAVCELVGAAQRRGRAARSDQEPRDRSEPESDATPAGRSSAWLPHALLAISCLLAALVNPNGWTALLYPLRLARLLTDPAANFTRSHFAGGWAGREALLGLLALAVLGALLRRSRRGRQLPPATELLGAALFTALAWVSSRLALEMLALVVPLACALWARPASARRPAASRGLALAALGLSALLGTAVALARPAGVISPAFPEPAARFLESHGVRGRMFNHQNWGGYLGWRLGEPIFWDGRNDVFAPLVRTVATTPFAEVARRYRVDHLVLSRREVEQLLPELASGRWALVYRDGQAAVFLRRDIWHSRLSELEIPLPIPRSSGAGREPPSP